MIYGRQRVIGILAHVDAGKTTLAEGILFRAGTIRQKGRVDHQDAFLDHFALERQRGITIFSKQARFLWGQGDMEITLLDTPGHVDFSAEMERTLQVLDYAILVISGADGVQGHTLTLWGLLRRYGIPAFLFVNKMDQPGTDQEALLRELQEKLDENCVAFSAWEQGTVRNLALEEAVSLCSEDLMEEYLETGGLSSEDIAGAIAERRGFPVYFGSALQVVGVDELLDGIANYTLPLEYPEEFGARVFQISRDRQGNRLTHLKITGGCLRAKQVVGHLEGEPQNPADGREERDTSSYAAAWEEKVDQIRLYNGQSFQVVQEAPAGSICTVTGLSRTAVGEGLGTQMGSIQPSLEPVMTYRLKLPDGTDPVTALGQLRRLQEEEPLLHVVWKEQLKEIHVQTMGEVQVEILKNLLSERFGLDVEFEDGSIVYKETLAEPVLGVGHFEPLRHYAEVQLLIEPGERGSGLQFASYVSEDELDKNWQRLILTHLEERSHPGVLVGGEITDLRISIVGGRAHVKHTEGGDFRQATYRALRQGLRSGRSILLEPVYDFTLELPVDCLGRAMTDVQQMQGRFEPPDVEGEYAVLQGCAPVAQMQDYQREVVSYTKGHGRLFCTLRGYEPCKNAQEIIRAAAYDPEADLDNPTGSVFCSHGAGTVIPWDQVYGAAHVPLREDFLEAARRSGEDWDGQSGSSDEKQDAKKDIGFTAEDGAALTGRQQAGMYSGERIISLEEIESILAQGRKNQNKKENDKKGYRRYHRGNRRIPPTAASAGTGQSAEAASAGAAKSSGTAAIAGAASAGAVASMEMANAAGAMFGAAESGIQTKGKKASVHQENCLLVDGYNVIYAWPHLRELLQVDVGSARDRLIDEMENYQGFVGGTLILVFDAYKVKGNPGVIQKKNRIYVVYTKEAETADQYIEKTVHDMASKYRVTVATSDGLEQMIIWGAGALRMSSLGLLEDLERHKKLARETYHITDD